MDTPDPAPTDGWLERLRLRILQWILGCIATYLLAGALYISELPLAALVVVLLSVIPWAFAVAAWGSIWLACRSRSLALASSDKSVVLFLVLLAPPAAAPASALGLGLAYAGAVAVAEVVPDREHTHQRFEALLGAPPEGSVQLVYHSQRDATGGYSLLGDSDGVEIFQFSVESPEAGREILRSAGLAQTDSPLSEREARVHPERFPVLWIPRSLSSDLEVWRADGAVAWLDARNRVAYLSARLFWRPASN